MKPEKPKPAGKQMTPNKPMSKLRKGINIFSLMKIGKRISALSKTESGSNARTSNGEDLSHLLKDVKPQKKFRNELWQVNVKNKILPYLTVNRFIRGGNRLKKLKSGTSVSSKKGIISFIISI